MIAAYLATEWELRRITADADVESLAATLIGAGHLLFAARTGSPLDEAAVKKVVTTVLSGIVPGWSG